MKFSHLSAILVMGTFLTFLACDSKKGDTNTTTEENSTVSPEGALPQDPAMMTSTTSSTTSPTGAEQHYKCMTAGCTGGSGSQGKCPICGADLVHNQAFHAQAADGPAGTSPVNPVVIDPSSGSNPMMTTSPPSAQNAQGVYHYTCTKGCAGGAASAGNCAKCGSPLAHNQAFHN